MEVREGKVRSDHGVLFKKVGADIPIPRQEVADQEEEEEHEKEGRRYGFSAVPLQGIAVSNKFDLTFFVTSDGYGVAHTDELVKASQGLVDTPKIINIRVESVRLLALSSDELTIAACLDSRIYFYNIPKLLLQIELMAKEIENLLSFIDGKCSVSRSVQKTGFTKSSLEVIENEIQKLSGNCHQFQMELKDQRQNLSDVLDDTMQGCIITHFL